MKLKEGEKCLSVKEQRKKIIISLGPEMEKLRTIAGSLLTDDSNCSRFAILADEVVIILRFIGNLQFLVQYSIHSL